MNSSWKVIFPHQFFHSSFLWLILSAFLTYFWLCCFFFFTEYMELHQFSLDRQCTLNFHHLLSFYFIYFRNQTLLPSGKCSWVRLDYYLNPSTFLIGRNNYWNRNSCSEFRMLVHVLECLPFFSQKHLYELVKLILFLPYGKRILALP